MRACGDDKTVAGDDRLFEKTSDRKAHALNCDAVDGDARAFGGVAGLAGFGPRIGCAVARNIDDFVFTIRDLRRGSSRKVWPRLGLYPTEQRRVASVELDRPDGRRPSWCECGSMGLRALDAPRQTIERRPKWPLGAPWPQQFQGCEVRLPDRLFEVCIRLGLWSWKHQL